VAKFDIETFVTKLEAQLKTNLTAKISAINTEKNDGLVLEDINANAWIFQSLDDRVKNYTNFIFYYLSDLDTRVTGPSYSQDVTIEVDMFIADTHDNNMQKKFLRYQRALIEASAQTWGVVGRGYGEAKINSLNPVDFQLNNSSLIHKLFGVTISFTIGFN
jgi:hypothetical protein